MTTDPSVPAVAAVPMPIEAAAHAATTTGPQAVQQTLWGKIHADVTHVGHVVSRLLPVAERIALSPALDKLFEAAMMADDLGVAAEIFQGVTDQLRAASARKAQPGADVQVVTTPAPTGPQPIVVPIVAQVVTSPAEAPGTTAGIITPQVIA